MITKWRGFLENWLSSKEGFLAESYLPYVTDAILCITLILVAGAIHLITKYVITRGAAKLVKRTKSSWDNELVNGRLLQWVAHLTPAIFIWSHIGKVFRVEGIGVALTSISYIYIVIIGWLALSSLLNAFGRIYEKFSFSDEVPIKGFLQVIKIVTFVVGMVLIVSSMMGRSPLVIFSGFGALTAILMLIFKDSILGLVAGIQLSANRMIAEGDWIEMPQYGANGSVTEVALTTVKVQNWDKTITTIPTYTLISDSFKNWRGMSNSGVRRIKRSININMNTVRFLSEEDLKQFEKVVILQEHLKKKKTVLEDWNKAIADQAQVNHRRLTNLGVFRAYIESYIKNHSAFDSENTLLVRQLQSTSEGVPMEVYFFLNDNRWVEYENVQSDIFDHLFSIIQEFDLQVYQKPSGQDFQEAFNS